MAKDSYEVGYKKPPKEAQFKKGRSGNPKGRPKGSPNFVTAVRRALDEKVTVTENGQKKTLSKLDAAAKQLVNRAASGDLRSIAQLLTLSPILERDVLAGDAIPLDEADRAVAESITKRIEALLAKEAAKKRGGS